MHWLPAILIIPYLLLIFRIYLYLPKIKRFNGESDLKFFISVVIACKNEEKNLPALLNSILLQDYPEELFEIIIVDDNSSDKSVEIASGFGGSTKIVTISNKGKGKKQALRTGINAASGSLIITTDADCSMGKSWISTIASFYEKERPDMIICPVQIESGSGFFRRFQELEFLSLQGITAGTAISGNAIMCNGANLAFTRQAYLNNSDFLYDNIASGDDIFFLQSLKKQKGSKIEWLESPEAMVTTESSPTPWLYLKQRKRWFSKAISYDDRYTILIGIVTFVTILLQISLLISGFFNALFFEVFLVVLALKSLPDFLVLKNTTQRYGKKKLINWFIPVQIAYPFYVLIVILWSINYPFLKET